MNTRALRRRCTTWLTDLPLPIPFDLQALCDTLAARRGRPIRLYSAPLRGIGSGLWLATADKDCIFFERETSPLHQQHIILHELGHLIGGHRPCVLAGHQVPGGVLTGLDGTRVQAMLSRTGYATTEEQEAEMVATLFLERIAAMPTGARTPRVVVPATPATETLIRHLAVSFDICDLEAA